LREFYRVGGRGSTPPRMSLRILGGDGGGGQTPMDELRGAAAVLQLVSTGDPFDLTGLKVRAHGKGEAHRVSVELRKFYRAGGQGSIPQPHQELPAVDPLPFHVPIVGGKVREAGMHGSRLLSDVPGDGVVGRVSAIPQDVGEGRVRGVHVQAVAQGSGHGSFALVPIA
jgi:hypothetical protein